MISSFDAAIRNENIETMMRLINQNREIVDINDGNGHRTPLMVACLSGKWKSVFVLTEMGANINIQNIYGETALIYAVHQNDANHHNCAKILLDHGANPNIKMYQNGKNALMLSCTDDNIVCIDLLLKHGALITEKDNNGRNAIDYARGETKKYLKEMLNYIIILSKTRKLKNGHYLTDAIRELKKY